MSNSWCEYNTYKELCAAHGVSQVLDQCWPSSLLLWRKAQREFWEARGLHEMSKIKERFMEPKKGTSDFLPYGSELALILNSTSVLIHNWSCQHPEEPRKWLSTVITKKTLQTHTFPPASIRDWSVLCHTGTQPGVCRIGSLWTSI